MKIDLDAKDMRRLEELAQREKRAPEEIAKKILSEGLSERECKARLPEDEGEAVRRQEEALERVYQKISKLPVAIKDGFAGRDHS